MTRELVVLPGVCNIMFPDRNKRKVVRARPRQDSIRVIEEGKMTVQGTLVEPGERLRAIPRAVTDELHRLRGHI
jgi:hypothetical protein